MPFCSCAGQGSVGSRGSRLGENLGQSGAMSVPTCNNRPFSTQPLGTDFCSETWSREGCYGMRRSCLGRRRVTWCLICRFHRVKTPSPGLCLHRCALVSRPPSRLAAAAAAAESLQLCPTLCDPMDSDPPGPSVHGILQARILEWVAISFSLSSKSSILLVSNHISVTL